MTDKDEAFLGDEQFLDLEEVDEFLSDDSSGSLDEALKETAENEVPSTQEKQDAKAKKAKLEEEPKKSEPKTEIKSRFSKDKNRKLSLLLGAMSFVFLSVGAALYFGFDVKELWNKSQIQLAGLNQGEVKTPLWQLRLNELERNAQQNAQINKQELAKLKSMLLSIQRNNKQISDGLVLNQKSVEAVNRDLILVQNQLNSVDEFSQKFKDRLFESKPQKAIVDPDINRKLSLLSNRITKISKSNKGLVLKINKMNESYQDVSALEERLTSLELKIPKKQFNSTKSYANTRSSWRLRSAGQNIAFLVDRQTGKQMRISVGVDVPSCGPVMSINARERTVTTQSCKISIDA